jgi:hypothetical protein
VLTRQVVSASEVAWRKHRVLQVSMTCAAVAAVFLGLAALAA